MYGVALEKSKNVAGGLEHSEENSNKESLAGLILFLQIVCQECKKKNNNINHQK